MAAALESGQPRFPNHLERKKCQRLPELATLDECSLLSVERERNVKDCQNWHGNFGQVRLPELATLDKCSLLYTEIDVKDCQNWQLWTSVVFSVERRVSKIARNGNFGQV